MNEQWKTSEPIFEADKVNDILRTTPWHGHRYFVYDLVNFVKPDLIVELGSYYGCSLFTFCQSIKDFKLNTKTIAIDTWKGDIHSGPYEEAVIDIVRKTISVFFKDQNIELKRGLFDQALHEIEDNSIDILHIDGTHTYEAVSHDYEMWLPKLRGNGIVLFHDTESHLEHGVNRFWNELKEKNDYPYFEFFHSYGLGILFPKGNKNYDRLKQQKIEEKLSFYMYKSMYEFDLIRISDLTEMVDKRYKIIENMNKMIADRDEDVSNMVELLKEKDEVIKKDEKMVEERDKTISNMTNMIEERDKTISNMTNMIEERDRVIKKDEKMVEERDETISNMTKMIDERDQYIKKLEENLNKK